MIADFIQLAVVIGYVVGLLLAARRQYQRIRPYTEPIACDAPFYCGGSHYRSCYQQAEGINTQNEAVVFSVLPGLIWPLFIPALLIKHAVVSGAKPLPKETAAAIKRLEAENERLRRQQGGGH
jgi:hypothetical protein